MNCQGLQNPDLFLFPFSPFFILDNDCKNAHTCLYILSNSITKCGELLMTTCISENYWMALVQKPICVSKIIPGKGKKCRSVSCIVKAQSSKLLINSCLK